MGKQHFQIQYSSGKYLLQDLNDGTGTFVRLDRPFLLRNNSIVSFGDSHLWFTLENYLVPSVTLKFIDGPKVGHL